MKWVVIKYLCGFTFFNWIVDILVAAVKTHVYAMPLVSCVLIIITCKVSMFIIIRVPTDYVGTSCITSEYIQVIISFRCSNYQCTQ